MSNVKFYKKNKIDSNATLTATSASTALFTNLYDNDVNTKLLSSGSDDSTPEVWEIEFTGSKDIDALQIANHNIKTGTLKYWDGAAYVDFSTPISWTANTESANYCSFTQVATTKLQLTMNTTMAVDAQKFVGDLRALEVIGTVNSNPSKSDPRWREKSKKLTTDDNSSIYVFFGSKFSAKLKFENANTTDLTLFRTLKDLGQSFYVYLGGGDDNEQEGYRIMDLYLVNYTNDYSYKLPSGYLLGAKAKITLDLREAS